MSDQDNLRDRIAMVLYIESSEAEDGDVVWESPEAIAEEIESWGRFAQAIIDELGLTVETAGGYGYGRAPDLKRRPVESRVVGKWEQQ